MKRKIIEIDEEACVGCGACADACHEGAIAMVNGKAKLIRDDYCDGLGNCLPACPADAIRITEREAAAFDQDAVALHMATKYTDNTSQGVQADPLQAQKSGQSANEPVAAPDMLACGCPGTRSRRIVHQGSSLDGAENQVGSVQPVPTPSQLSQWPVQIKLVPVNAPYFSQAKLLVAADCTAYAFAGFHEKFIKDHITLIGCPKLDEADYADKLTEILRQNSIESVTVVRMEVPCCGGLEHAVKTALQNSRKLIPWRVVVISTDGRILEES